MNDLVQEMKLSIVPGNDAFLKMFDAAASRYEEAVRKLSAYSKGRSAGFYASILKSNKKDSEEHNDPALNKAVIDYKAGKTGEFFLSVFSRANFTEDGRKLTVQIFGIPVEAALSEEQFRLFKAGNLEISNQFRFYRDEVLIYVYSSVL